MVDHHLLQGPRSGIELGAGVHRPQACSGSDLIVPTASRMELRGNVSYLIVQHPIDEGVDIFVGTDRLSTLRQFLADERQAVLDRFAFFQGEHAGSPERHRPGLR